LVTFKFTNKEKLFDFSADYCLIFTCFFGFWLNIGKILNAVDKVSMPSEIMKPALTAMKSHSRVGEAL
jgi:hypothetical protein